jgi:hypothetical protein
MDARGVDRATALVCGPPTALTDQLALTLADDGFDVHRPLHRTGHQPDGRDPEEAAVVGAVAGRARPLGMAVLDLTGGCRTSTLEAVVAVMNGHDLRRRPRLVLQVDDPGHRGPVRRPQVGCEAHVGVLALVRHPARPADHDPALARRLARQVVTTAQAGRTRTVREPGRSGRVAALTHPAALRSVVAMRSLVGRWSW